MATGEVVGIITAMIGMSKMLSLRLLRHMVKKISDFCIERCVHGTEIQKVRVVEIP